MHLFTLICSIFFSAAFGKQQRSWIQFPHGLCCGKQDNPVVCISNNYCNTVGVESKEKVLESESNYDGPQSIMLWHSFSQEATPKWELRGQISVQNVVLQQSHLSSASTEKLLILARRDAFYRLKAIVKTSQGREIEFFSFVKACALVEAQLSDILTISVDHEGSVIAVTLSVPLTSCGRVDVNTVPSAFNTTIDFRPSEQGPIPDTASYIQKIERERDARERGDTKDTRSFLAKYWMYIVPVIIFLVVSGATNPEGAAPGGGGGR